MKFKSKLGRSQPLIDPRENTIEGITEGDINGDSLPKSESSTSKDQKVFQTPPFEHIEEAVTPLTKNPFPKASCISLWLFWWLNPIMEEAQKRFFTNTDLYQVGKAINTKLNMEEFDKIKEKNPEKTDYEIAMEMISAQYRKGTIYYLISNCIELSIPLLIKQTYINSNIKSMTLKDWILPSACTVTILFVLIIRFLFYNQSIFLLAASGARLSSILRSRIFEKLFTLTQVGTEKTSGSKVITMMTYDINNASSGLMIIPDFLNSFILFSVGFYFIRYNSDVTLVLVGLTLFAVLVFRLIHLRTTKYMMGVLEVNDEKSKSIRRLLNNIKFIKNNRLEKVVYENITTQYQVQNLLSRGYMDWDQAANVIAFFIPTLFALLIFGYTIWTDENDEIEENSSYLVLTVLSIMRNPISTISDAFRRYPAYKASLARIKEFLGLKDKSTTLSALFDKELEDILKKSRIQGMIEFNKCSIGYSIDRKEIKQRKTAGKLKWTQSFWIKDLAELKDLNFRLNPGEKCVVVSDSRESSRILLRSICKELEILSGYILTEGEIVYQEDQMSFVEDTIQQNIILGTEYNTEKYWKILEKVGLENLFRGVPSIERSHMVNEGHEVPPDLRKLIILARILYLDPDIYLIDRFFDRLPMKYRETVLKDLIQDMPQKTMLVNTRFEDVFYLFDRVLLIQDGTIMIDSQITELSNIERQEISDYLISNNEDENEEFQAGPTENISYIERVGNVSRQRSNAQRKIISSHEFQMNIIGLQRKYFKKALYFKIDEENAAFSAQNSNSTLTKFYLFNSGRLLPFFLVILIFVQILLTYFFSWFLTSWKFDNFSHLEHSEILEYYLLISLLILTILIVIARTLTVYVRRVTFKLFIFMIKGLLGHSLEFFHKMPPARIINVFITEFTSFDYNMGFNLYKLLMSLLRFHIVFCIALVDTYYTSPFIVIVYFLIIRAFFMASKFARSTRSVILANQSVLVQSVLETSKAIQSVRNYAGNNYHRDRFRLINDVYQNARSHQTNLSERWLSNRVYFYVIFVPIFILLNSFVKVILGGEPDKYREIKVTISLDLIFTINRLIRSTVMRAILMTSLEKVKELIVMDEWAQKRKILAIGNLPSLSQASHIVEVADLNVVNPVTTLPMLSDIRLEADRGFRVAIVGSRGSGKNTLLAALKKELDPAQTISGKVNICGRPLDSFSDEQLSRTVVKLTGRFKLLNGTLRQNIDPDLEFLDNEIIKALEYLGYWRLAQAEKMAERIKIAQKKAEAGVRPPLQAGNKRKISRMMKIGTKENRVTEIQKMFDLSDKEVPELPSFRAKHKVISNLNEIRVASEKGIVMKEVKSMDLKENDVMDSEEDPINEPLQSSVERGRVQYFRPSLPEVNDSRLDEPAALIEDNFNQQEAPKLTSAEQTDRDTKNFNKLDSGPESGRVGKVKREMELHEDLDLRIEGCSFEETNEEEESEDESSEEVSSYSSQLYKGRDRSNVKSMGTNTRMTR